MLQPAIIAAAALFFMTIERVAPGRPLAQVAGWYLRAAFLNLTQLAITVLTGLTWNRWLQGHSLFHIGGMAHPVLQGFCGWFTGTFIFYWWHRARHDIHRLWLVFHQIHHSPQRIETLTAFYKHPVEIMINSVVIAVVMFVFLGASVEGVAWYNVFAAIGEFFYHCNMKTPKWVGYFIQRPECHSIHHQLDVHNYNFGDIPLWDRLFGTFRDADGFVPRCGFPDNREIFLARMLAFKDNYRG